MTEKSTLGPTHVDGDAPEITEQYNGGAMWGWIAGIAILILIVFVLVGGMTGNDRSRTQASAVALDIGTCSVNEVGDQSGSRVDLSCASGKKFSFVRRK